MKFSTSFLLDVIRSVHPCLLQPFPALNPIYYFQTTNSITFAVYMLAENPHILKRLRQEILETVGETRRPTFDDMKEMKYLRAVINETIRLYPAVYVSRVLSLVIS